MRGHARAALAFLACAAAASPPAHARPLTRQQAVAEAIERNPELLALRTQVDAEASRVRGARLFSQWNPDLSVSAGPRFGADVGGLDVLVSAEQPVEIFGQRGARIEAAEGALAASRARVKSRELEVAAEVRAVFARALADTGRAGLAGESVDLARQTMAAARARLEAGAGTRLEENTAKVELGRATREQLAAGQRLASAVAALAVLIGAAPGDALSLEGAVADDEPPELKALLAAVDERPDVRAAEAELAGARTAELLARAEGRPVPRFGGYYAREATGEHVVLGTIGLTLPLVNRNDAAIGVAEAQVAAVDALRTATSRNARIQIIRAHERLQAARGAARAYAADVVAAMTENLDLVGEAYRAGKLDLLQLILIRRETVDARRGYIDAQEELELAQIELARASGRLP